MQDRYSNLIICFFNTLNNKKFEELQNYLAPDVVFHFPGTKPLRGAVKVTQLLKIIYHRYPDLYFEIVELVREGEKIAVVWKNSATGKNKKSYTNEGVTIVKIKNDKIIYLSDYFKDSSFTQKS